MTEVSIIKSNKSIVITKDDITFTQFGIADEILDLINEQKEEIERLNKDKDDLQNRFNSLMEAHKICDEENERLNNILNELEEWLEEEQKLYGINQEGFSWGIAADCLDKLKELKLEKVKNNKEDWFFNLLKEMVKNNYTITDAGKIKILREKSSLTAFNFHIQINKSVFEDVLSEEEKAMLWLEGDENK